MQAAWQRWHITWRLVCERHRAVSRNSSQKREFALRSWQLRVLQTSHYYYCWAWSRWLAAARWATFEQDRFERAQLQLQVQLQVECRRESESNAAAAAVEAAVAAKAREKEHEFELALGALRGRLEQAEEGAAAAAFERAVRRMVRVFECAACAGEAVFRRVVLETRFSRWREEVAVQKYGQWGICEGAVRAVKLVGKMLQSRWKWECYKERVRSFSRWYERTLLLRDFREGARAELLVVHRTAAQELCGVVLRRLHSIFLRSHAMPNNLLAFDTHNTLLLAFAFRQLLWSAREGRARAVAEAAALRVLRRCVSRYRIGGISTALQQWRERLLGWYSLTWRQRNSYEDRLAAAKLAQSRRVDARLQGLGVQRLVRLLGSMRATRAARALRRWCEASGRGRWRTHLHRSGGLQLARSTRRAAESWSRKRLVSAWRTWSKCVVRQSDSYSHT